MVSLPVKPKTTSPFALFGDEHHGREEEPNLELLEFLERKVGNDSEAKRLHDLRMAPILEQERIAAEAALKAKEEADFVAAATAEFETTRKTESLASRKRLLLALKHRIKDHFDNGTQELKGKIFAELSVIDTLHANGIKTSRPSDP